MSKKKKYLYKLNQASKNTSNSSFYFYYVSGMSNPVLFWKKTIFSVHKYNLNCVCTQSSVSASVLIFLKNLSKQR